MRGFTGSAALAAVALLLAGCVSSAPPAPRSPAAPVAAAPVVAAPRGPVIAEDGRCTAPVAVDLAALRLRTSDAQLAGLTECELVALKGPPLSVQTGSSPQAKRETTMLYMETSGKAIYLFADDRLVRVVRAGAQ